MPLLLLLATCWLAGCTHATDDNAAFQNHYFETRVGDTTYITGSLLTQDKVRAGKVPDGFIKSRGAHGQPVEFEDDGQGLGIRLMAEYDRRHGINR